MKRSQLAITCAVVVFVTRIATAQTNTFPASGNAGIGITTPITNLHISSPSGASTFLSLEKQGFAESGLQFRKAGAVQFYIYSDNGDNDALKIQAAGLPGEVDATPRIHIPFNSKDIYLAQSGGNVGIGTATPDAKLAVKGIVHAQEVKVDMLGSMVPDYVFEPSYTLPSLESIKTYIDQNKHLPEVPSAQEMEANGLNLGEMNMLLLKKVEELTLYVIELKMENQKQRVEKESLQQIKNEQERSAKQAERTIQELKLQQMEATRSMEQLVQRMEALERRNK